MNNQFKKGFEKNAAVGEILTGIGSLLLAPSIKRYGFKSFDYAKRKAMGLAPRGGKSNKIMDYVYNDIDKVENMTGIRKKVNKFIMEETPLMGIWMGSAQGKMLGAKMKKATPFVPKKIKGVLADVSSADDKIVGETMGKIKDFATKATGATVGAGLGVAIAKKKMKKKSEDTDMKKSAGALDAFKKLFGGGVEKKKRFFIPVGFNERTEKIVKKMTSPGPLIAGGLATGIGLKIGDRLVDKHMDSEPIKVVIVGGDDGRPKPLVDDGFSGSEEIGLRGIAGRTRTF